jgi:hypothetical protein
VRLPRIKDRKYIGMRKLEAVELINIIVHATMVSQMMIEGKIASHLLLKTIQHR